MMMRRRQYFTNQFILKHLSSPSVFLQCFQLDKFEPYDTEFDLVETGLQYITDGMFWAGKDVSVAVHSQHGVV